MHTAPRPRKFLPHARAVTWVRQEAREPSTLGCSPSSPGCVAARGAGGGGSMMQELTPRRHSAVRWPHPPIVVSSRAGPMAAVSSWPRASLIDSQAHGTLSWTPGRCHAARLPHAGLRGPPRCGVPSTRTLAFVSQHLVWAQAQRPGVSLKSDPQVGGPHLPTGHVSRWPSGGQGHVPSLPPTLSSGQPPSRPHGPSGSCFVAARPSSPVPEITFRSARPC